MADTLALMVLGLGLFFLGLHLVGANLKHASGGKFRSLLTHFTKSIWRGSLLGVLVGAAMQSTSAVTVILASMASSGLVTVSQTLPVVAWSNVGTTVLVFASVIDLRLMVLYLLGVSALVFVFCQETRWQSICGVLLGIGLLFYGMDAMKSGGAGMQRYSWFQEVMAQSQGSYGVALAVGIVLSFLTQSTTAVSLIAVTLVKANLLGANETMMVIYGGNVGSTFARMILSSGLRGSSRQIGRFQDLFKIAGSALFVVLFYLEILGGVPLVKALVEALSPRLETQMALVNLVLNVTMAVLLMPLLGPIHRMLDHFWPATEVEDFAKLRYLHAQVLTDPDTALDLVEKEEARLVTRLPDYVNALRPVAPGSRRLDHRGMHQAFVSLAREIETYHTRLIHLHLSPTTGERLTNLHNRHQVIMGLEESILELVGAVERSRPTPPLSGLVQNLAEALEFLLVSAAESVTTRDPGEADMLAGLSSDRGSLLGKIRDMYLSSEHQLTADGKSLLLALTTLFDRIVWSVRRFTELLQQAERFQA
jgi:phosphate:Na+ symporter